MTAATADHLRVELRAYQVDALTRVEAAEARGVRRQLGVAATGLGKTIMFCALAQRRGGRTLILAHRDELVNQAVEKVREVWPGVDVGIVKGTEDNVRAQVVVASVQTLARSSRMERLTGAWSGSSLLNDPVDPFDLVVVDEAHHAAADSYRRILDALRAGAPAEPIPDFPEFDVDGAPPGPLLLGVTATPDRGDGHGLDDLFDEISFSYDILWGIRSGYLADIRGLAVKVENLNLASVKVSRGDYQAGAAGQALEDANAPELIAKAIQEQAAGRRTLVFTPTVATASLVVEAVQHRGINAAWVSGETPIDDRRRILRDFESGAIDVVANCMVLTEGYDNPRVDCIVVARPTKSRALYTQMIGRGTRRHPDKRECLVLDVVGAAEEHSLVTIPSLFGVDEKRRQRMTDGTAELTDVLTEQDDEAIAAGRIKAEEVEMFRRVVAQGIAWVQVHDDGASLRRYVRPLGKDRDGKQLPTVVLAQRTETEWTAGLLFDNGDKRVLMALVEMEMAQGVAEDFVRKQAGSRAGLVQSDAAWRTRKPTPKAKAAAKKWRLPDVESYKTAGDLSDALTAHIARKKGQHR